MKIENYKFKNTLEEINEKMPLEFSVEPDSIIRVLMQFKPLEEYIEIPKQDYERCTKEYTEEQIKNIEEVRTWLKEILM